jgi:Arc-like DNA binding domain
MTLKNEAEKILLRVPDEIKIWVKQQAELNWTSMNAEIIRCIRTRMESERSGVTG